MRVIVFWRLAQRVKRNFHGLFVVLVLLGLLLSLK